MSVVVDVEVVCDEVRCVVLTVHEGITCASVLQLVKQELGVESSKKVAWQLLEVWNGCKRKIPLHQPVPVDGLVSLQVTIATQTCLPPQVMHDNKRKKTSRLLGNQCSRNPTHFLCGNGRVAKSRHFHCAEWLLRQRLERAQRKRRDTLLRRMSMKQTLWTPPDSTPFDKLYRQLSNLEADNLRDANEVADMNIAYTRLTKELEPVEVRVQSLQRELTHLQHQAKGLREDRQLNTPPDVDSLRAELTRFLHDLEKKKQTSSILTSNITKLEDHLKKQRNVLQLKKNKMADLNRSSQNRTHPLSLEKKTATLDGAGRRNLVSVAGKKRASSLKLHGNKVEVKGHQLAVEEGHAFKHQCHRDSEQRKWVWSHENGLQNITDDTAQGSKVSTRLPEDTVVQGSKVSTTVSEYTGVQGSKVKEESSTANRKSKRVRFVAEAVILHSALGGELQLLKECVAKVGVAYRNEKGATCLHNGVCSGSGEVVEYLINCNTCDINAQDIDGWTPLHCAVAFGNVRLVQYLVEHGASLYLTTIEGDTPLSIGRKTREEEEIASEGIEDCITYLTETEEGLGRQREGQVYALFDWQVDGKGQLPMEEGERFTVLQHHHDNGWWMVRNMRGQKGEIPFTYLGPYRRVTDVL